MREPGFVQTYEWLIDLFQEEGNRYTIQADAKMRITLSEGKEFLVLFVKGWEIQLKRSNSQKLLLTLTEKIKKQQNPYVLLELKKIIAAPEKLMNVCKGINQPVFSDPASGKYYFMLSFFILTMTPVKQGWEIVSSLERVTALKEEFEPGSILLSSEEEGRWFCDRYKDFYVYAKEIAYDMRESLKRIGYFSKSSKENDEIEVGVAITPEVIWSFCVSERQGTLSMGLQAIVGSELFSGTFFPFSSVNYDQLRVDAKKVTKEIIRRNRLSYRLEK